MSRFAVVAAVASVLVACGACSKKSDTAQTPAPGGEVKLPEVVDKTAKPDKTTVDPKDPGKPPGDMTPAIDASYKLAVFTPQPGPAGAEAVARVTVKPGDGWHMNKDFPIKLQLAAPDGVTLTKTVMETGDVSKLDDNELAFDVKLKAARAGSFPVNGDIKFAVCTPDSCDPKHQTVAFTLVAQ